MNVCMQILNDQELTARKAIVNQSNSDGWTPLHVAASEGHIDLIDAFIEFGANKDSRSLDFRTPLHVACIRGNLSVI
jgi:ankyrin repeat protein